MTQRHECGGTYIGVSECTRREEYDGIGGGSKWGVSIYDGTGSPGLTLITLHVLSIGQGSGRFAGGRSGVCAISGVCATTLYESGIPWNSTNHERLEFHGIPAVWAWISMELHKSPEDEIP